MYGLELSESIFYQAVTNGIWQLIPLQRAHSSPTCYNFPAPSPEYGHTTTQSPVIAALYTGSSSGEPGMILISSTGTIRFWESMSLALANVDRYQNIKLELAEDDFADMIWNVDVSYFS